MIYKKIHEFLNTSYIAENPLSLERKTALWYNNNIIF